MRDYFLCKRTTIHWTPAFKAYSWTSSAGVLLGPIAYRTNRLTDGHCAMIHGLLPQAFPISALYIFLSRAFVLPARSNVPTSFVCAYNEPSRFRICKRKWNGINAAVSGLWEVVNSPFQLYPEWVNLYSYAKPKSRSRPDAVHMRSTQNKLTRAYYSPYAENI